MSSPKPKGLGKLRLKSGELLEIRTIPRVRKFVFMDTLRARRTRLTSLTRRQKSIIVGSLLGDAYLVKTTCGYAFRVNHGLLQKCYVDWKYEELKNLTNSAPRQSTRCYYFRTVSHKHFLELQKEFYRGGAKNPS